MPFYISWTNQVGKLLRWYKISSGISRLSLQGSKKHLAGCKTWGTSQSLLWNVGGHKKMCSVVNYYFYVVRQRYWKQFTPNCKWHTNLSHHYQYTPIFISIINPVNHIFNLFIDWYKDHDCPHTFVHQSTVLENKSDWVESMEAMEVKFALFLCLRIFPSWSWSPGQIWRTVFCFSWKASSYSCDA